MGKAKKRQLQIFIEPSLVKLGNYDIETEKQLAGTVQRSLELATLSGAYFIGNDFRVLVFERVVVMVERQVKRKMGVSEVEAAYGKPSRIFENLSGLKTFVYGNFALDIQDSSVSRVIHYLNQQT